mgnify:CR=1 FL=1
METFWKGFQQSIIIINMWHNFMKVGSVTFLNWKDAPISCFQDDEGATKQLKGQSFTDHSRY